MVTRVTKVLVIIVTTVLKYKPKIENIDFNIVKCLYDS